MSEPARASILLALLDGVALPAGRLARIANVSPQTASSHLNKLVEGHLLAFEKQGRHHYYRLSGTQVADAIEALLTITPLRKTSGARDIDSAETPEPDLVYARTCYSHLAGQLAVEIAEALQSRQLLIARQPKLFTVTKQGRAWFQSLGIAITDTQMRRPRFARRCLDWTERRHHVAGELGSAMLTRFCECKWIVRRRESRAMRITLEGERKFRELLGIEPRRG
jgi:DNA-binding transcriptional ArsR family regulator